VGHSTGRVIAADERRYVDAGDRADEHLMKPKSKKAPGTKTKRTAHARQKAANRAISKRGYGQK
jgi:hypothetical protein